eukprot:1806373-Prymnesium_polylepis.1
MTLSAERRVAHRQARYELSILESAIAHGGFAPSTLLYEVKLFARTDMREPVPLPPRVRV